jgi:hypothetical protein
MAPAEDNDVTAHAGVSVDTICNAHGEGSL